MNGVTVLLSGGVDSTLCAYIAAERGILRRLVFIDYGQQAAVYERQAAQAIASRIGIRLEELFIDLNTDEMNQEAGPGARVIAGRNETLICMAAEGSLNDVWFGAIADDYVDYEDCRPEWVSSLNGRIDVRVVAPLIHLSKRDVMALAIKRRIPLALTWSCYSPVSMAPCLRCNSCIARLEAGRAAL